MQNYRVIVADNYHYLDESQHYTHGYFDTLEGAVEACRLIVDRYLENTFKPGMGSAELYADYQSFGDDPYVVGVDMDGVPFSAWDYANLRCTEICK